MYACALIRRRLSVLWTIYTFTIVENPLPGTARACDASSTTVSDVSSLQLRTISTGSLFQKPLQLGARIGSAGSAICERLGIFWTRFTPAGVGEILSASAYLRRAASLIGAGSFVEWAGNAFTCIC